MCHSRKHGKLLADFTITARPHGRTIPHSILINLRHTGLRCFGIFCMYFVALPCCTMLYHALPSISGIGLEATIGWRMYGQCVQMFAGGVWGSMLMKETKNDHAMVRANIVEDRTSRSSTAYRERGARNAKSRYNAHISTPYDLHIFAQAARSQIAKPVRLPHYVVIYCN